ncbi:MAG TPA: DivIVA domain-containing protein [Pedococcus sp.]
MIWVLFTVVAVLLVGVVAALVTGRLSYDPMPAPVSTAPDPGLRESFGAGDIEALHFDTALRGYRMDQVDEVLDRLQDRLAEQERELALLRATPGDRAEQDRTEAEGEVEEPQGTHPHDDGHEPPEPELQEREPGRVTGS